MSIKFCPVNTPPYLESVAKGNGGCDSVSVTQMPVDIVTGLSDAMAADLAAKLGFTGALAGLVRCLGAASILMKRLLLLGSIPVFFVFVSWVSTARAPGREAVPVPVQDVPRD